MLNLAIMFFAMNFIYIIEKAIATFGWQLI